MDPTPEQPFAPELPQELPSEASPASSLESQFSAEAPPPSTAHTLFYGPFGLRAGWSLLIYLAILASLIFGVHLVRNQIKAQNERTAAIHHTKPATIPSTKSLKADPSKPAPLSGMIIGEVVVFAIFFFLSWLMAYIERRKLSAFGLGGIHPISRLLIGAVWGFLALSLLILTLHAFHLLTFDALLDHGPRILFWGALQLFAFFLVGLVEEYLFRGYIQFTLTRGLVSIGNLISRRHARAVAFWIAAVLTSTIFFIAHTHNGGEDKLGLFQVFLAGIVLVVALWRTGSLWWGIGFHMAWDWSQSFLYGVPDSGGLMQGRLFATHASGNPIYSGGTVGPEGSVLCIPILLLILVVLFFTHPSPQPPLELPLESLPPQPTTLFSNPSSIPPPLSSLDSIDI